MGRHSGSEYDHDAEKGDGAVSYIVDGGVVHAEEFTQGDSWIAKAQRIAGKLNIEQRGIERVPEDERTDTNGATSVGTMWLAANMVVSSFAIGALATPVFGLGFVDTILTIFFINMLGIIPVSFFSTFGPRFGFLEFHRVRRLHRAGAPTDQKRSQMK